MPTYTATLFLPGQPAHLLTANELAALAPARYELTNRLYLGANLEQVARHLHTDEAEPLANHYTAAVYGIFNFCDDQALNPAADPETLRLFNIEGLFGPLLLIEDITGRPEELTQASEQDDEPTTYPGDLPEAAEREDGPWLSYHEATRGRRDY